MARPDSLTPDVNLLNIVSTLETGKGRGVSTLGLRREEKGEIVVHQIIVIAELRYANLAILDYMKNR